MILLIKKYRLNKNINLRELASLSDCSYSYLDQLENNKKNNPRLDVVERIGHALEICPKILIGGCYENYCNPTCSYYSYFEEYSSLPVNAKIEILSFARYINGKYNIQIFQ